MEAPFAGGSHGQGEEECGSFCLACGPLREAPACDGASTALGLKRVFNKHFSPQSRVQ